MADKKTTYKVSRGGAQQWVSDRVRKDALSMTVTAFVEKYAGKAGSKAEARRMMAQVKGSEMGKADSRAREKKTASGGAGKFYKKPTTYDPKKKKMKNK